MVTGRTLTRFQFTQPGPVCPNSLTSSENVPVLARIVWFVHSFLAVRFIVTSLQLQIENIPILIRTINICQIKRIFLKLCINHSCTFKFSKVKVTLSVTYIKCEVGSSSIAMSLRRDNISRVDVFVTMINWIQLSKAIFNIVRTLMISYLKLLYSLKSKHD